MAQQTQEANAVDMLKKDHQTVEELFQQFDQAQASDQQAIATEIFNALDIHTVLEEEIFYPAVRERIDFNDVLEEEEVDEEEDIAEEGGESDEDASEEANALEETDTEEAEDVIAVSYQEHQMVKDIIKQLKRMDVEAADYQERFNELKDAVMDHVSEEEELIFPAARLKLDLNALGEQMQERRIALVSSRAA